MTTIITAAQTASILATNKDAAQWHILLVDMLPRYKIDRVNRIAGFMAQCAHESQDFRMLEENLNYSDVTLLKVFPRYFGTGKANAAEYARNPEKLANYVYMDVNRSKNGALGNTQPGDGWKFRGGGIKQLTGRNNYAAFGKAMGKNADQAADYVRTKQGALESACWFWDTNNLNDFADKSDIVGMSKRINGGTIGLSDRTARWNKAIKILTPATQLRRGSKGSEVITLQRALGIEADGIFGANTEQAIKRWQSSNNLPATGVADAATTLAILNKSK